MVNNDQHEHGGATKAARAARVFLAIAVTSALLSGLGFLAASAWYADDQCFRAAWQCDAGGWGLLSFVLGAPVAAAALLVASIAWALSGPVQRRSR